MTTIGSRTPITSRVKGEHTCLQTANSLVISLRIVGPRNDWGDAVVHSTGVISVSVFGSIFLPSAADLPAASIARLRHGRGCVTSWPKRSDVV